MSLEVKIINERGEVIDTMVLGDAVSATIEWTYADGSPVEVGDAVETIGLIPADSDCGIVDSVGVDGIGVRWVNGGGTTMIPNADDIRYVPPRFRSVWGPDDGRPVWEGGA